MHPRIAVPARALVAISALRKMRETEQRFGRNRIVLTEEPQTIRDPSGVIIGVDAMIRVFNEAGREASVDPHRVMINPPVEGDFLDTYWQWLAENVEKHPNPKGFRTRGTVTTVYADVDGHVQSTAETYTLAREGSGTFSTSAGGTSFSVGQVDEADGQESIYEGFLRFNTSSILGSISDASLQLYVITDTAGISGVLAKGRDFGSTINDGDFVDGSSLFTLPTEAQLLSWSTGQYNTFSNVGLDINQSGYTSFLLVSVETANDSPPIGDNYVRFATSENSGTSADPKLVITHSTPGATRSSIIL